MIRFFHKKFLTLDQNLLAEWLIEIAKKEGQVIKKLEYNFVKAFPFDKYKKFKAKFENGGEVNPTTHHRLFNR